MPYSSVTLCTNLSGWGFRDPKVPRTLAGAFEFLVVFYLLYYNSAAYREMSWAANIAKPLLVFLQNFVSCLLFQEAEESILEEEKIYVAINITLLLSLPHSITAQHCCQSWMDIASRIDSCSNNKKRKRKNIFRGNFLFFFAFNACTDLI